MATRVPTPRILDVIDFKIPPVDLALLYKEFDEQRYLLENPDVADVVKKGVIPSGLHHYVTFGHKEGRAFPRKSTGGN